MEIKTINLFKKIDKKEILKGINITFEKGQANVIIGPNGAGKTSLLKQIAFLDKPSKGEISYNGLLLSKMDSKTKTNLRRGIGFVFQNPVMFSGTVYYNLVYALKIRKQEIIKSECEKILDLVGLLGRESQDVKTLSGGEKQRLSLARVFILDPDIYLFDEPINNLDAITRRTMEDMLSKLIELKKTVVLVTHNLVQARKFADKIFFMKDGRIIQQGTSDNIFLEPVNLNIAEYTFPENIFHGKIIEENGQKYVLCNGLKISVVAEGITGEVAVILPAADIFVSKGAFESSARNSFYGNIKEIKNIGNVYSLIVEVNSVDFETVITKQSLLTMGIKKDDNVYITFKATSVHIIKR